MWLWKRGRGKGTGSLAGTTSEPQVWGQVKVGITAEVLFQDLRVTPPIPASYWGDLIKATNQPAWLQQLSAPEPHLPAPAWGRLGEGWIGHR